MLGALDVRRRAGADVGQPVFREVLLRLRQSAPAMTHGRRCRSCQCRFRRAVLLLADDRRVGRDLWRPARLRAVLPDRPILHVFHLSDSGEILRRDHRRHLPAVVDRRRRRRHRAHRPISADCVAGYLYLKGGRIHLLSEVKYRYLKWRINRMRRKFDVYSGGRADDVNRRVH